MYYYSYMYPYQYYSNAPMYAYDRQPVYPYFPGPFDRGESNGYWYPQYEDERITLKDYGKQPFVVNIEEAAEQNNTFRTALWTGNHLQVTLMSIPVGGDIGLEVHPDVDQFLRIEEGEGVVKMGDSESNLTFQRNVTEDFAIMVPAGKWHNVINTGNEPLKLYSIYAPPEHPFGTVHRTKTEAMAAENQS
ncbi:cupin domain-containing protein [Virgibacillus oceani]|uniref:Cupin type-2 domain-containing protein n=1 Tax=Virgibacillus oceani TaxID=1479511 RepID=A0A917HJ25_9BACI|nr:cupin domain-containing protein [Virgibacillus oceani]GGG81277.1 hypothetical protein GCM10011398_28360 [Virgibacillus oceani]